MSTLVDLRRALLAQGNPTLAAFHQHFFKTGCGEYGEGDQFLGVKVPDTRKLSKFYRDLDFQNLHTLIQSKIHEERLIALFILVDQYIRAKDEKQKADIYHFYLDNLSCVNNWDLVDQSAPQLVGHYLFDKDKSILIQLAKSNNLWQKRIAILATLYFIKQDRFDETLKIAELLLNDMHDLIHKAVGWMLREVGKRNLSVEEAFLKKYYRVMPRTMLRYAIEHFEESKRQSYLKGNIG